MQVQSLSSFGAVSAEKITELSEYPEVSVPAGEGGQIVTIGKYGLGAKFSDEVLKYSNYDLINLYLRLMSKALARKKESNIWAMIHKTGISTHDNLNPDKSIYGTTTGYGSDGSANYSLSMDDIIEGYTTLLLNGFIGDTLIVNPMTFMMFLLDPVMRMFAANHGGGSWYNMWEGNAKTQYPHDRGLLGKVGPGPNANPDPLDVINSAKPKLPPYVGLPLRIMVSNQVPYDPVTKLTDVYMVDSNNLGVLLEDEAPTVEEIDDRSTDSLKVKVRERYAILPYNDGQAAVKMKNIKVEPNRFPGFIVPNVTDFTAANRETPLSL